MYGLTQKEASTLSFLKNYIEEFNGVSPSFEEIRIGLRLKSKSGVHRLLSGLERRGHIRRLAYRSRSIAVIDNSQPNGNYCSHCGAPSKE